MLYRIIRFHFPPLSCHWALAALVAKVTELYVGRLPMKQGEEDATFLGRRVRLYGWSNAVD